MLPKYRFAWLLTFALGLVGLIARSGLAQDDPIVARMKKDIYFLASDECEGRGVGTKGLDKAAEHIAAEFKKAGLKPGGVNGTYFQPFPFCTNAELNGDSTLILDGPKSSLTLQQGVHFQVLGTSSTGKITAPIVFVGYGVTARGIEYDDYAGIDVKGKVVIALRRVPRWNDKEKPFDGPNKDDLAGLDVKLARGQANKAAAVILVNDATETTTDALMPFAQMSRGITTTSIPFVQMRRAALELVLLSSTGKSLGTIEKAIDKDLKPQSAALQGWSVNLDVKVNRTEVMVKNVIGYVDGAGPLADENIVVGAHYDHLGYGGAGSLAPKEKGKIHYGADDNGSGTTAVMELARRFGAIKNREGRRMVFMTFTAEERGLIGSRHYCRIEPLFPLKSTAAMFNLDMVGRVKTDLPEGAKPKLLVLGMDSGKGFEQLVSKHNPGFDVVKDKSVFGASDHYSFYVQKIPVLFFFTGTHPEYHRPTDTADKINVAGMKKVADFTEKIVDHWRTDPKRPDFVYTAPTFTPGVGSFPKMGILPDYTFGGKGVLIEQVTAKGPADMAGLKKGDIITEIAGKEIPNVKSYMSVLATQKANVALDVKILRDSKEMKLKVTPK